MPNSIAYKINYASKLDKKLEQEAVSSVLDVNQDLVGDFVGARQVKVRKLSTDGLGNYSTSTGYPMGAFTLAEEVVTLAYDRGKKFPIDRIDDLDSGQIISANVMGEFIRLKVAPEVDAIRFAKYASSAGTTATPGALTADTITDAVDAAEAQIGQTSDPTLCKLFVGWGVYALLKKAQKERFVQAAGTVVDTNIEKYDGIQIVRVPDARFTVAPTVSATDGYTPGAQGINFLLINPACVQQIKKHENTKIISPDVNQTSDDWLFFYRLVHDAIVLDNQKAGIYAHLKAAA